MLYTIMRWEEKQILLQARGQNVDMHGIALKDTVWSLTSPFPPGSVVLLRCPGYFSACRVGFMLETMGHRTVNRFEHVHRFGQKIVTDHILARNGFPAIPSVVVFSLDQLDRIERSIAYPMICKPCIGGFGRLVHKIESRSQLLHVWDHVASFAPAHHQVFYLQPFLSVAHDIRVILLGGKVVCAMERLNAENYKKNIAQGGRGRRYILDPSQKELMLRLGRWLPYGFFGVDLLKDQTGHTYICEINAVCSFREATQITGVDVAGQLVGYLDQLDKGEKSCDHDRQSEFWALPA